MDDQTPEMERLSAEMRELMRRWVQEPDNEVLQARYRDVHAAYTRLYMAQKKGHTNNVA